MSPLLRSALAILLISPASYASSAATKSFRAQHPTGSVIFAVTWARDGGNVTTGDMDGCVRMWDVLTGACTQTGLSRGTRAR